MMEAATVARLEDIVRRESRSLLQYVSDAFPWTTPEEQDALAQLQQMIAEELQGAWALGHFLARNQHRVPYLGSYPTDFTSINFVSFDHLLPLLVNYERRAIAQLESDLPDLNDPAARNLVQDILNVKRRHLQSLSALAAAHSRQPSTPQVAAVGAGAR